DLDPVAGRVLRREQREGRAGAGAEAGHLAVIDHLATVQVGGELYQLPHAHRGKLRFLEIRVDPDLIEGNDRHQGRTRGDSLPELDRALGDEARHRRGQSGARIGEIGVADASGGITYVR